MRVGIWANWPYVVWVSFLAYSVVIHAITLPDPGRLSYWEAVGWLVVVIAYLVLFGLSLVAVGWVVLKLWRARNDDDGGGGGGDDDSDPGNGDDDRRERPLAREAYGP